MNPILDSKYYIPDVEARQWEDGKVYLYGSMDIAGQKDYCSKQYCVFESSDLKNWKAYPKSFCSEDTRRPEDRAYSLYAPDCERIQGRYCLFYCQEKRQEGVAFSEHPYGPFQNAKEIYPADGDGIDPAILVDDDGSQYYFWGQFHARGGKLDLESGRVIPETIKTDILTEEKHGFHEGVSARKINGLYYLVFSDISRGRPTCLGYATSEHPLGPYRKRGIIIDNTGCDPDSWNNHGSIAEVNGNWYVFYHRSTHNSHFSRQVCMEPIYFNEDGSIDEVEMTTQGVDGPLDAFHPMEAYRTCSMQGHCYIEDFNAGPDNYMYITDVQDKDKISYKYFDFTEAPSEISVEASCLNGTMFLLVVLDKNEDEPIAKIKLSETGDGYQFFSFKSSVFKKIRGVHSLHFIAKGDQKARANIKAFCFDR